MWYTLCRTCNTCLETWSVRLIYDMIWTQTRLLYIIYNIIMIMSLDLCKQCVCVIACILEGKTATVVGCWIAKQQNAAIMLPWTWSGNGAFGYDHPCLCMNCQPAFLKFMGDSRLLQEDSMICSWSPTHTVVLPVFLALVSDTNVTMPWSTSDVTEPEPPSKLQGYSGPV